MKVHELFMKLASMFGGDNDLGLYDVNANMIQVNSLKSKNRHAFIKVAITSEDAQKLLSNKGQAFLLVADIGLVERILKEEKADA